MEESRRHHGRLWACGSNSSGQCGIESIEEIVRSPTQPDSVVRWSEVALGDSHACGITEDGSVYTWGLNDRGQCAKNMARNKDEDKCLLRPTRVSSLDSFQPSTSVSCGFEHSCCVIDGGIVAWGSNEYGQCGTSAGHDTGSNGAVQGGQPKGDGSSKSVTDFSSPITEISFWKPRPVRSLRGVKVVSVVCGHHHTLCLTFQGSVFAWGSNSSGQLGLGDTINRPQPEMIESLWATPVISLAAGSSHTLALTRQKMVLSWGRAKYGQLGLLLQQDSEREDQSLKQTHSTRFSCVSPTLKRQKSNHFGMRVNQSQLSSLREMGIEEEQAIDALIATNNQGVELAIEWVFSQQATQATPQRDKKPVTPEGSPAGRAKEDEIQVQEEDVLTPRRVNGISNVVSVDCGTNHSVICTEGGVFSFGYNRMGQLGLNCRENVHLPRMIEGLEGKQIVKVSCGTSHTIFLSKTGAVYGCGTADEGQLGQSIQGTAIVPEKLDFKYDEGSVADIIAGGYTTIFLQKSKSLGFRHDSIKDSLSEALQKFLQDGGSTKKLISLVESIFASPELMNVVFGREEGFGMDVEELEKVYKLILKCGIMNQDIIAAFHAATNSLIRDLGNNSNLLNSPESIQVLLAVFQNPLLSQSKMAYNMMPKICKVVMDCISISHQLLTNWWSDYPANILGGRIVRPFQDYISTTLDREHGNVSPSLICTLNVLALVEESNQRKSTLPMEEFYNPLISEKFDVLQHYIVWRQNASAGVRGFSFCNFPFLLNNSAKSNLLQTEAKLTMAEMVQKSRMENMFGGIFQLGDQGAVAPCRKGGANRSHASEGPSQGASGSNAGASDESAMPTPESCGIDPNHSDACILRIRRTHIMQDALEEIGRQNEHDLHKPLKVNFIGEEGVDAGGVKKEFFQLLCEIVMQPDYDLFVYHDESRTVWFNGASLESEADFMLIGLVFGLAIYNSVILDVHFPLCLYKKLLGQSVGIKDLGQMQPEVARSLKKLLDWEGPGSVEDVFCATFTIDHQAFGEVQTYELMPGGADIAVTEENRHKYVDLYVDFLLNESIRTQFNAFKRGFLLLCDGPVLRLFRPQELEVLVTGTPHLDFKALEENSRYEGNYTKDSQVVKWLWQVVSEFSLEEKQKFLKFFSGSDRSPIGGLSKLRFLVQRAGPDTNRLPTSHTCFNTLLLPEYGSRGKLRALLKTAIENAAGFGLE
ncbi:RCC1-like regulator of chromosome condensation protein [Chloropicon primus]|uniref:RCC1-like regulator of chromosome condensation protein n=2 Tax=Chloropicon primus TaxID=1764295 RepID=A0A5B8N0P2_9CHLO|nr:RCC1-like regulator of chromosome condensation protein [Chloropicon primus]UPR04799.1 RCC1-like regulator of chromosome condensation protein [Chloropicon primus]|eukprot:QDZ25602.1 RCC1-like regulator of chromosome condensation protein [Chloropicon primus]